MMDDAELFDKAEPKDNLSPKKKRKRPRRPGRIFLMVLMLLIGFFGGQILMLTRSAAGGKLSNFSIMRKLSLIEAYVDSYYLNDYDARKAENNIYRGFMGGLDDDYAEYYSKEEFDELMEADSGKYVGIGVTVYKDQTSGYVVIEQVMKDKPAYNAGVRNGDILIAVGDKNTADMTLTETVNLIKNGDQDEIGLSVLRDNKPLEITVKRSSIEMETVSYEMKKGKTGYISISEFIENTDEQFAEALDSLREQGMAGLVIDLRDNGGGLLDTCINIVSKIIPEGDLIVYTEDKKGKKTEYRSNLADVVDLPMAILVNGNSASASEVMTGCLKDYGAAAVVGTRTFGKGIVQNIFPLMDGSAVKMTVSNYYTPKGSNIHGVGIEPDVVVKVGEKKWAKIRQGKSKDTQLEKAFEVLKNQR